MRQACALASSYSEKDTDNQMQLSSLNKVALFLCYIHSLKLSTGADCSLSPSISISTTASKTQNVWRSKYCMVLAQQSLCLPYRNAKQNIQERELRSIRPSLYVCTTVTSTLPVYFKHPSHILLSWVSVVHITADQL